MHTPPVVSLDHSVIRTARHWAPLAARLSLAIVYAWFGSLKVLSLSPASPLVLALLAKTLPFLPPGSFLIWFGLFEVLIGMLFLFPTLIRPTIGLMVLHMGMTVLPLLLLPSIAWDSFMVPTLEGQYMLKNLVLIALAISMVARTKPLKKNEPLPKS
ncbi:hypothetical protein HYV73_02755 [Candidatus Uhrbacteria bacterium]|nr:hypothetical protein [Candidatus Uhrbacteria bacterium]